MTSLANGAGPALSAALDVVLPTLEGSEETGPERIDLEQTGAKTYELLDAVAAALLAQIANEQAGREYHEQMVRDSKEREHRLKRTLATIESQANAAEKREQKQAARPSAHSPRRHDWRPTDEKLGKMWRAVLAYVREHPSDRGFSPTQVAGATRGLSPEAMGKGIAIFREHELIRLVGKIRGGGRAWALMPDAEERGTELWPVNT